MKKFTAVTSKVIPLPVSDVDTDMIIPAQFLTSVSREGYGQNLFRRFRDTDPQFPLNLERYRDAKILAADSNFGCGSSREHAVWALQGAGVEVVIAKSFADIFSGNSMKNGLLLAVLPEKDVDEILAGAAAGEYQVSVDLPSQSVILAGGRKASFNIDPFRKHCIINGLDDIDYIMSNGAGIEAFRRSQEGTRFFSTLTPNNEGGAA